MKHKELMCIRTTPYTFSLYLRFLELEIQKTSPNPDQQLACQVSKTWHLPGWKHPPSSYLLSLQWARPPQHHFTNFSTSVCICLCAVIAVSCAGTALLLCSGAPWWYLLSHFRQRFAAATFPVTSHFLTLVVPFCCTQIPPSGCCLSLRQHFFTSSLQL